MHFQLHVMPTAITGQVLLLASKKMPVKYKVFLRRYKIERNNASCVKSTVRSQDSCRAQHLSFMIECVSKRSCTALTCTHFPIYCCCKCLDGIKYSLLLLTAGKFGFQFGQELIQHSRRFVHNGRGTGHVTWSKSNARVNTAQGLQCHQTHRLG